MGSNDRPGDGDAAELHRIVRTEGALMYLAHPSRRYGTLPPDDLTAVFDRSRLRTARRECYRTITRCRWRGTMRLPGIGGSDAHSAREIGTCATRFTTPVVDEPSFLSALRSGAYAAERV